MWGDAALTDARNTLQHGIAQLREALEPARGRRDPPQILVSDGSGYRLALGGYSLDASLFETAVEDARVLVAARPEDAAESLEAALALWRGAPYEEFGYADFARASRSASPSCVSARASPLSMRVRRSVGRMA